MVHVTIKEANLAPLVRAVNHSESNDNEGFYEEIKKAISRKKIQEGPHSMWRYIDLLPVEGTNFVGPHAGLTPLVRAKNLGAYLGLDELYIKNDTVNHPTLSFKDRVVAVALTRARELGFETVACASTGNLANSVSAHAAAANLHCYVFIPDGRG